MTFNDLRMTRNADFDKEDCIRDIKRLCNRLEPVAKLVSHDSLLPGTDVSEYKRSIIKYNAVRFQYNDLSSLIEQINKIPLREEEKNVIKIAETIKIKINTFFSAIGQVPFEVYDAFDINEENFRDNNHSTTQNWNIKDIELIDVERRLHGDVQKIIHMHGEVVNVNLTKTQEVAENLNEIEDNIGEVLDDCIDNGEVALNAVEKGNEDLNEHNENKKKSNKCTWMIVGGVSLVLVIVIVIFVLVIKKKI
ncbi:hypothetical protein TRFO_29750 [Tritrichomonas foetus]|uniref:t-SNARE coiled-coil homology domain-containing protein n=1 Tax=Tritrichomonas foetus TaxID=1144522 RepID=A0A1J4JV04_9EUKA|nr:hypothetical protein TRFO_29750 [Tritrichomonas foetus]|eukprot:OHT02991.1 hypothetical protein TRFO_29750 [Tritrichomonas foetus]